MIRNFILSTIVLVCSVFPAFAEPGTSADIQKMLEAFDRPTPAQLRRVPWDQIEVVTGPIPAITPVQQNVFGLFNAVIAEMRQSFPDSVILVFGRDGEFFHDAYHTVARPSERARLSLIQASRGLVKNSKPEDLVKFLELHKVKPADIFAGKQKVLMFDTGSRGQIFGRILGLLVSLIPENDPQRYQKLMNLYENVEGRLIVAVGQPSKNEMLAWLRSQVRSNVEIAERTKERLFYHHLPSSGREAFGLGKTFDLEYPWLVNNVEHTPKWRARTERVDAEGKVYLVPDPKDQGDINPLRHMIYQLQVLRHFLGNRPWLIEDEEASSVEPIEAASSAPIHVQGPAEIYARIEDLIAERSATDDEDRKKSINEQIGRLLRNTEVQDMVIRLKLSSSSFAHVVRRAHEELPPDFLKKYADAVRALPRPTEKQEKALLKCSQRLQRLGIEVAPGDTANAG